MSWFKRRWSFCLLALLVFALVCCVRNTPIPATIATSTITPIATKVKVQKMPLRATEVRTVPLGGNLNGESDYSADFVFADAVKTAGPFHSFKPDGSVDLNNLSPVDANGWPTGDFSFYVNEITPQPGTYHFSCKSSVQPTVSTSLIVGTVQNSVYNPQTQLFTAEIVVDPKTEGQFVINVNNTKGGVTNMKLIRPGYDPLKEPLFTNDYLNLLKSLSPNVLRFMDWHQTNGNLESDWSERSLSTDARQQTSLTKTLKTEGSSTPQTFTNLKGIAWEYCIALANELKKDMWINVPVLATDDYVTHLAQLLKTKLNPKLKVYVEYSNEVWNDSFSQTHFNRQAAVDEVAAGNSNLNYDQATDSVTLGDRRVAKRLKEISDIFIKVWGDVAINTRIRPVLAYQGANNSRFMNQLAYINAVYGSPDRFFYAIAIAPYFSMSDLDKSNPNLTTQQVLDAFDASVDGYQNSNAFTDSVTIATYYGLKLMAYEGGPDTFGGNNIAAKKNATLHPHMKNIVQRYLKAWYSHGGDQFNWYSLGAWSFETQYGTYSITNDLHDLTQPKELGFNAVRRSPLPAIAVGALLPGELDARSNLGSNTPFVDPYVRYIAAGSKYDYLLRVPSAKTYNLKVSVGSSSDGQTLDVLVNNHKEATVAVPNNGKSDYGDTFADTAPIPLKLQAGLNVVRLFVSANRPYNLNSLKFYNADGSGISNTLPMLGACEFYWQETIEKNSLFSHQLTVDDVETSPAELIVSGSSDNLTLVPKEAITFTRDPKNSRLITFTVTPRANQTGVATITLTARDLGGLSRSVNFKLTVN